MPVFLTRIGGWFLKNPAVLLSLVMGAAFVMVVIAKNAENAELRRSINDPKTGYVARISRLQTNMGTLRANNTVLASSVASQNASLDQLKSKADAADAKFDASMAQLGIQTAGMTRKVAEIAAAKPGADRCVSAYELVKGAVR